MNENSLIIFQKQTWKDFLLLLLQIFDEFSRHLDLQNRLPKDELSKQKTEEVYDLSTHMNLISTKTKRLSGRPETVYERDRRETKRQSVGRSGVHSPHHPSYIRNDNLGPNGHAEVTHS